MPYPQVNDGDRYEGMQKMAKEQDYEFPYAVDASSDVARHFGAKKPPDIFQFDGKDKRIYYGAVDNNSRKKYRKLTLRTRLMHYSQGTPLWRKKTKDVGCENQVPLIISCRSDHAAGA